MIQFYKALVLWNFKQVLVGVYAAHTIRRTVRPTQPLFGGGLRGKSLRDAAFAYQRCGRMFDIVNMESTVGYFRSNLAK